ncbi:MAG: phage tail tape measure protein [Acidaminococcaceae bacterium]|nr:phage tail tape measure protein [Acidaminococcaceae bacterium]
MADYVLSAVLSLKDQFTAKAKSAQKSIQGVKAAATSAAPAINGISSTLDRAGRSADTAAAKADKLKRSLSAVRGNYYAILKGKDELSPVMDKVQAKIKRVTSSTAFSNFKQNLGNKLSGGLKDMAGGVLMGAGMQMLGGAGIGFGLYNSVKSAMDFESAMSGVRAITNASQEDFEKLRNKALEMGATTKFTATESAQALNFMGMAGWNAEQSVAGLPGIMHLAAASGEDLAMVSDIVTDSMSAFGLAAEKSGEFADVLAAAATKSNTNVGKMGFTFKYAAPLAGALKYSVQDVALAIGTMADSGIKGEQAGTSLRSLFTRLAKQPKEAAVAMQNLGLSIKDATTGKMKPLRNVLTDLRQKFKGLTEEQKTQYAAMLAGTEGMSGLLAIVNGDEKKFRDLTSAIDNSSGAAKRMADIRLDNLSGDLTYLSSAWDGLVLKVMKGDSTSGLRGFVQELNSLVNHFSKSIDKNGLGVRSVLDLVGKTVVDLKNKFLELDGVGSILAGGALAGGLYKLYKGAKGIADMIRGGPSSGLPGTGSLGGSSVGSMTVQAGTVFVNGKSISGGAEDVIQSSGVQGGSKQGMPPTSKWATFGKFAKVTAALGVLATAYETYNAAPEKRVETAARGVSGIAGAEVGAAIGTAVAGPVGMVVGSVLGSLVTTYAADKVISGDVKTALEDRAYEEAGIKKPQERYGGLRAVKELNLEPLQEQDDLRALKESNREILVKYDIDVEANDQIVQIEADTAKAWQDLWSGVAQSRLEEYQDMTVQLADMDDGLQNSAIETGSVITDAFRRSSDDTKSVWAGVADWFSGVFASISSAVKSLGSPSVVEADIPAHATGALNFQGGLTQINEHGGELVDLPSGSRIYPAQTTERILRKETQAQRNVTPSVSISGNTFVVREDADIDKIAYKLIQMMGMAESNYGGVG